MKKHETIRMVSTKKTDKSSTTAHANLCDRRTTRRIKRVERAMFIRSLKDPDTYACFWSRLR